MDAILRVGTELNPEAMVRAAVAAADAANAAWWATAVSVLTLLSVFAMGLIFVFMAFQLKDLVKHTNGMRQDLMDATRKLAFIEGNIAGRAELREEEVGQLKRPT